ncbi:MAG: outer membrane beta-barrel protein, partial [Rikenellaceae bacterium]
MILTVALMCATLMCFSQSKVSKFVVKGAVIDSTTQKAIGFATISIKNDSSKIINAVAADASGKFSARVEKPGNYKFEISFMGYGTKSVSAKLDPDADTSIDIGTIALIEGLQLDVVNVVVQKQLITSTPDKIAYNLEADPEAATSTTFEILRKVPMISIDGEENVKLNGESNYKVLVNGKTSSMMSKNFKDVIKSMPANSIKNIEVITNPPTKYDAEGIGGIINIITNKRSVNGYNGNINVGTNNLGSVNGSAYVAAQMGKFAISANVFGGLFINKGSTSYSKTENFTSEQNRYSVSDGASGKSKNKYGNISLEASYEIDSLNLITLSGWGYLGRFGALSTTKTRNWDKNNNLTREYDNIMDYAGDNGSGSGSINYQKTFKKPEQTLTFSYNIDASPQNTEYTSLIDGILNYNSYGQYSDNNASGVEHTIQVDYYDPINKMHQYEAGVKYILRRNVSNTDIQELDDAGQWIENNAKVNDLDYNQHIGSVYGGYVFKHKKFSAKAGVRGELTVNTGVSKSIKGDDKFNSDPLFNVVPYVNLSYMLNKG